MKTTLIISTVLALAIFTGCGSSGSPTIDPSDKTDTGKTYAKDLLQGKTFYQIMDMGTDVTNRNIGGGETTFSNDLSTVDYKEIYNDTFSNYEKKQSSDIHVNSNKIVYNENSYDIVKKNSDGYITLSTYYKNKLVAKSRLYTDKNDADTYYNLLSLQLKKAYTDLLADKNFYYVQIKPNGEFTLAFERGNMSFDKNLTKMDLNTSSGIIYDANLTFEANKNVLVADGKYNFTIHEYDDHIQLHDDTLIFDLFTDEYKSIVDYLANSGFIEDRLRALLAGKTVWEAYEGDIIELTFNDDFNQTSMITNSGSSNELSDNLNITYSTDEEEIDFEGLISFKLDNVTTKYIQIEYSTMDKSKLFFNKVDAQAEIDK